MNARGRIWFLSLLVIGLGAGCSQGPRNLSPTPEDDPERHARAVAQAEEVARQNREAEAQFYRRLRSAPPSLGSDEQDRPDRDLAVDGKSS